MLPVAAVAAGLIGSTIVLLGFQDPPLSRQQALIALLTRRQAIRFLKINLGRAASTVGTLPDVR